MGRAFEVRKHAMAKTAAAKTRVYAKYGKEIYMAAKGNPDADINVDLRRIIEKAKKDQVPNDIIKRAIDRAKGGTDDTYIEVRYEGFGPGDSLIIVECLTDNVNRSIAEVRNCFTKTNSKLGVSGSVSHMFNHQAVFAVRGINEEEALEIIIENDLNVADIEADDEGVSIFAAAKDYNLVRSAILQKGNEIELVTDEIMWVPMMEQTINDEENEKMFQKLLDMLDELDDVKDVYHNIALL
ncbi:MAG TPA: YebC/PmpR family DNA-binding transcriptional regulator [Acholeplasmataceae bacterium]|nr:YebC/PmpR family DNA-binding transcriptional regulator [Acholeplasmataceae bacterium]